MGISRSPAVAGTFYPDDAGDLLRDVERCLGPAGAAASVLAIVAPHAGYIYSGSVAGAVYRAVRLPRRVVLLGPNHTGRGVPLALYPGGDWTTPLGPVEIDPELTRALAAECPGIEVDLAAHRQEHALEVQIPFLQVLVPGFRFAAVCVGTDDLEELQELGRALARVVAASAEPVLLIASSDMNHYEAAAIGSRKDQLAIARVLALDPVGLHRAVHEHDISMCGFAPTVAVLTACRALGASTGRLVRYAHSGEVSGDNEHVVGYAGMTIA